MELTGKVKAEGDRKVELQIVKKFGVSIAAVAHRVVHMLVASLTIFKLSAKL